MRTTESKLTEHYCCHHSDSDITRAKLIFFQLLVFKEGAPLHYFKGRLFILEYPLKFPNFSYFGTSGVNQNYNIYNVSMSGHYCSKENTCLCVTVGLRVQARAHVCIYVCVCECVCTCVYRFCYCCCEGNGTKSVLMCLRVTICLHCHYYKKW